MSSVDIYEKFMNTEYGTDNDYNIAIRLSNVDGDIEERKIEVLRSDVEIHTPYTIHLPQPAPIEPNLNLNLNLDLIPHERKYPWLIYLPPIGTGPKKYYMVKPRYNAKKPDEYINLQIDWIMNNNSQYKWMSSEDIYESFMAGANGDRILTIQNLRREPASSW